MFELHYSVSTIFVLIIVIFILTLAFSLVKTYLPLYYKSLFKDEVKFTRWLYLTELFTILMGLIVFVSYTSSRNIVVATVLMLLLVIIFYFVSIYFIRDYIIGLILKISGKYKIGDQINVENIAGEIVHFGKTQIEIKDTNNSSHFLPYHLVIAKVNTLQQKSEKVNSHQFLYELPNKSMVEKDIKKLIEYIQLLPWIHPAYPTNIEIVASTAATQKLEITVYTFEEKYNIKIEQAVNQYFKKEL